MEMSDVKNFEDLKNYLEQRFNTVDASLANLTQVVSEQTKSYNQLHDDMIEVRRSIDRLDSKFDRLEKRVEKLERRP